MATYSDLSGIFHIQQRYLTDLYYSGIQNPSDSTVLAQMRDLRGNLTAAYNSYKQANVSTNQTLTHQNAINTIIENEKKRIDLKKSSVDSALYGQKRMAQFSDSYSKKYYSQIKILFVIIIVLLVYLGLTMLNNIIPVPDVVFVVIMVIVGVFAVVIVFSTLIDIYSRYNMDFDKINFRAPSTTGLRGNIDIDGNILGNIGGITCIEETCCPEGNNMGVVWDPAQGVCKGVGEVDEGFTSMSNVSLFNPVSNIGDININGIVKPYEPSEINSYMKI